MHTFTRGWVVGVVAALLVVLAAFGTAAQQAPVAGPPADSVKVFLDCVNVSCDFDFFRTEITFVDYVRDRKQADVHLLITGKGPAAGERTTPSRSSVLAASPASITSSTTSAG